MIFDQTLTYAGRFHGHSYRRPAGPTRSAAQVRSDMPPTDESVSQTPRKCTLKCLSASPVSRPNVSRNASQTFQYFERWLSQSERQCGDVAYPLRQSWPSTGVPENGGNFGIPSKV